MMITLGDRERKIPVHSFQQDGRAIFSDKINGHFMWDILSSRCDPNCNHDDVIPTAIMMMTYPPTLMRRMISKRGESASRLQSLPGGPTLKMVPGSASKRGQNLYPFIKKDLGSSEERDICHLRQIQT